MEEKGMATGPTYRVPFRRRKEGKTYYQLRKGLILSRLPRLVVRGTSRYMIVQMVKAEVKGDKVIVSASSEELTKTYGWKGGSGNVPAAYLAGLLCGYRAVGKGVKKAVLDIGLQSPSQGSRIFAAMKGVIDAGVVVPHREDVLPKAPRISGQHIADYAKQLAANPEAYQAQFSTYLSKKVNPETIPEHFSRIKGKISSNFEG
jgi:large subunit ribosomal protein L18